MDRLSVLQFCCHRVDLSNEIHHDQVKNEMGEEKIGKGALLVPCELGLVLRVDLKSQVNAKD